MRVSDAYPSKFLKATDLQGREHRVTIGNVAFESVGDDKKLIVYFAGKTKGLVLNKTNARSLAKIYGDDSRAWADKEVILYETVVDFRGESMPTIRLKFPPQAAPLVLVTPPAEPQPQAQQHQANGMNDEIPF